MKTEQIKYFKDLEKSGVTTLYCIIRSVAQSGMSRVVSLHYVADQNIIGSTWNAAALLDLPSAKTGVGVKLSGCGMDMCHWLVSRINAAAGTKFEPRTI